ncbi:hypothetical protein Dda3937_04476 [Dickeya dadantii 3937]|uniref:Uncharacterized protein n=1 Tax=Dickeya dadantii (strain 3937) TaxID=198628 RepID=E0SAH5_DICD3|nr:hypothetical protein Dda3937_04476 [Dickeya dadantii 3937]
MHAAYNSGLAGHKAVSPLSRTAKRYDHNTDETADAGSPCSLPKPLRTTFSTRHIALTDVFSVAFKTGVFGG